MVFSAIKRLVMGDPPAPPARPSYVYDPDRASGGSRSMGKNDGPVMEPNRNELDFDGALRVIVYLPAKQMNQLLVTSYSDQNGRELGRRQKEILATGHCVEVRAVIPASEYWRLPSEDGMRKLPTMFGSRCREEPAALIRTELDADGPWGTWLTFDLPEEGMTFAPPSPDVAAVSPL